MSYGMVHGDSLRINRPTRRDRAIPKFLKLASHLARATRCTEPSDLKAHERRARPDRHTTDVTYPLMTLALSKRMCYKRPGWRGAGISLTEELGRDLENP